MPRHIIITFLKSTKKHVESTHREMKHYLEQKANQMTAEFSSETRKITKEGHYFFQVLKKKNSISTKITSRKEGGINTFSDEGTVREIVAS